LLIDALAKIAVGDTLSAVFGSAIRYESALYLFL